LLARSRAISEQIGFREGVAWCLNQLGLLAVRRGEAGSAERLLLESLQVHRDLGDQWRLASVLEALAATSVLVGDPRRAAVLLGAAGAVRERTGAPVPQCELPDFQATLAKVKEALGEQRLEEAFEEGKAVSFDQLARPAASSRTTTKTEVAASTSRLGPRLVVKALGPVEVSVEGRLLEAADWGWAKPRELFLILLSSPPRTKEQLGAMLWPDLGDEQLRNVLHTALRDLRRALSDKAWVVFNRGRYAFNATLPHYYDVIEFESALAAAQRAEPAKALEHLERALALYQGDFLEETPAGEWAEERRRQLSNRYGMALMAVGAALSARGEVRRAVQVYERAVAHDPFDEGAHRQLMKSLARVGERARALRTYDALAARLEAHLDAKPAPETLRLYGELRAGG
jgi:DNA-binding SARP family transcriptional activator